MTHRLIHTALGCICCLALLAGCADQQGMNTGGDPGAMQPPPRPAELDQLNSWAGQWTSTGEFTCYMPDGPQKMTETGTVDSKWSLDNRFLVSNCEGNMGEMGTSQCMSICYFDAHSKKFRTTYYSSVGDASSGTLTYDAANRSWHLKGEPTYDSMIGKKCTFEACITMPDNNTMVWDMTMHEVGFMGFKGKKAFEGRSTMKRKG